METASVIINAGIFVATVIAGIIAWRSVKDARDARDSAAAHEARALGYSRDASAAATRSADALEEANRREEARDAARVPWLVTRVSTERWRVVNNTGAVAIMADFAGVGAHIQMEDGMEVRDVPHGQPVFIGFGGGFSDPATATVRVTWVDPHGRGQQATFVLG